ncbi:unnamed protein product, partial [Discosporangium mesarthrocarpum]
MAVTFAKEFQAGVRLTVEFMGSVEDVAHARGACKAWRAAVKAGEARLFKVVVRRAGVSPKLRGGFWEYMVLGRKRARCQSGEDDPPPLMGLRPSLSELSRKGMASVWSKAIDADVARTFGRPISRSIPRGVDDNSRQSHRHRHWWPESMGGPPLGSYSSSSIHHISSGG